MGFEPTKHIALHFNCNPLDHSGTLHAILNSNGIYISKINQFFKIDKVNYLSFQIVKGLINDSFDHPISLLRKGKYLWHQDLMLQI